MLWGLFLPLTNLLISFHQQSSVLLHQGTTFIHFCDALPISAISLKMCTPKLQLLHNTEPEIPTIKFSGVLNTMAKV